MKSIFPLPAGSLFCLLMLLSSFTSYSQSEATSDFKSDSITLLKLKDGTAKIGFIVQNRDSDFVFAIYNEGPVIIRKNQVFSLENKQKSSVDHKSYRTIPRIDSTHSKVTIGLRSGLNLSEMHSDDHTMNEGSTSTITWFAGGAINIPLSRQLSLQPELLYSRKGLGIDVSAIPGEDFVRLYINYLEAPVLLQVKFNAARKIKITLSGGAYAGYLLSGAAVTKSNSIKTKEKFTGDDLKETNRFDYGIAAGTGVLFKTKPGDIGIDFRYDFGLSNINKPDAGFAFFNRVLSFSASYFIPL